MKPTQMASEAQIRVHELLREKMREQILARTTPRPVVTEPFDVRKRLAEGQHPRDILRDFENYRPPPRNSLVEKLAQSSPIKIVKIKPVKPKTIPKKIRTLVWNEYIGKKIGESTCVCCDKTVIDKAEFQCGHILARANGGTDTLENLRPICAGCNTAMGIQNMEQYCMSFFGRNMINRVEHSDDPVNEVNYKLMKVNELRELCKTKGLKGASKAKKSELIAMLSKI